MTAWFALAGKRMANPITHAHPVLVFMLQCICETAPLRNCRVERMNSQKMAEGVAMLCLSLRRSIQHATLEQAAKRARDHSLPNVQVYTSAMTDIVMICSYPAL